MVHLCKDPCPGDRGKHEQTYGLRPSEKLSPKLNEKYTEDTYGR